MSVATDRKSARQMEFKSHGVDQLLAALNLFFGEGAREVYWCVDDKGYHLAHRYEGRSFIPRGAWVSNTPISAHLPAIAFDIIRWLDSLGFDKKREICGSWPTEAAYTRDPGLDLVGFRITSDRSLDGENYMLTIVPAWV